MQNNKKYSAPELLTKAHDVSKFGCGKPPLNQYIKKYALINQEKESSRTFVTVRDDRVVGYFTLSFGSISHEDATDRMKEEMPRYLIPIILLARLAVVVKEKGNRLGEGLCCGMQCSEPFRLLISADFGQ
jgi:hypothetical protein